MPVLVPQASANSRSLIETPLTRAIPHALSLATSTTIYLPSMHRILAADDDPLQLDFRKSVLETGGHAVVSTLSVRATTRALEDGRFDLIVMDLRFPNVQGQSDSREGLRLIRQIRDIDSKVPIIVLSGWPADIEGQPEEKMVSRVLLKTIKPTALLGAARELLPAIP
jgi:CheY-like chemotaxis protein